MTLVNYEAFAKQMKARREKLGLNMADMSFHIKVANPGVRITPATISRVEALLQADINYSTAYYWDKTLSTLENSQIKEKGGNSKC